MCSQEIDEGFGLNDRTLMSSHPCQLAGGISFASVFNGERSEGLPGSQPDGKGRCDVKLRARGLKKNLIMR